ncbi:MAG: o-succinylbenzoate synthase [Calothrix sp. MO_167.B12]|nr:o-succinylbenzoate synthase [Calothrix sp. MO_167.B12]
MAYSFEFRPYRRKFARPLITSHGIWDIREGIIIRLRDGMGRVSWGEIAPISWFGSETLEQALDFCQQLPQSITDEVIFSIPDTLPACQFGFESALGGMREGVMEGRSDGGKEGRNFLSIYTPLFSLSYSGLLPAGEAALTAWEKLWQQGYRTLKWKIAVDVTAHELEIFHKLIRVLPDSAKLRLDANGGLSYQEAQIWLENCDRINGNIQSSPTIEFIEQPLPVGELQLMLTLSRNYQTAIALDESVATLNQLVDCYEGGWRGIFIIKPGIAGSPSGLRQFCQQYQIDAVFSSVMETTIGRQAALQLATELTTKPRAVGFGINHWFTENEATWLQQLW